MQPIIQRQRGWGGQGRCVHDNGIAGLVVHAGETTVRGHGHALLHPPRGKNDSDFAARSGLGHHGRRKSGSLGTQDAGSLPWNAGSLPWNADLDGSAAIAAGQ